MHSNLESKVYIVRKPKTIPIHQKKPPVNFQRTEGGGIGGFSKLGLRKVTDFIASFKSY
jgi:hypothetical protein